MVDPSQAEPEDKILTGKPLEQGEQVAEPSVLKNEPAILTYGPPMAAKQRKPCLVVIVEGYRGNDPPADAVQVPESKLDEGLGRVYAQLKNKPGVQLIALQSSSSDITINEIARTVSAYKKTEPHGYVVLIGHSMGGDNVVVYSKENRDVTIDLMITLDIMDYLVDDDNIYGNVKNIINYYQTSELLGGEKVEIQDSKQTTGVNILAPGSVHTSIDNDLSGVVVEDVRNFISGEDTVTLAAQRRLPVAKPTDSTILERISSSGRSSQ